MTPLRIVFFGTPAFALPTLRALLDSPHAVVAVLSQPDRPRGRGQRVRNEAVAAAARQAGLSLLQPERLRDPAVGQTIAALGPDLGVVAAYGKLLPDDLLAIPRLGTINVHASLLPRWRGAAPVHRAVMAGDAATGVTIMRVITELDAGPMLATVETAIEPDETSAELEARLADLSAPLLVDTVNRMAKGPVLEVEQNASFATYAPRLERRESEVDWGRPAAAVHNQIRGLHPWPLAAATFLDRRTVLVRSRVVDDRPRDAEPGTVTAVLPDAIEIATAPGAIRLVEIQVPGRRRMSVAAFLRGHRVSAGDAFGPLTAPG